MRRNAGLLIGRSVVLRLLLVVALAVGLSAMHVLAGVVGQQHAQTHVTSPATLSSSAMSGMSGGHGHTLAPPAPDAASPTSATQTSDHEHHSAVDCVLFLSAGIAVLVVLIAWAAARALRPSYRPADPWLKRATTSTPWRGPPPWHWPRISLCVIRV